MLDSVDYIDGLLQELNYHVGRLETIVGAGS